MSHALSAIAGCPPRPSSAWNVARRSWPLPPHVSSRFRAFVRDAYESSRRSAAAKVIAPSRQIRPLFLSLRSTVLHHDLQVTWVLNRTGNPLPEFSDATELANRRWPQKQLLPLTQNLERFGYSQSDNSVSPGRTSRESQTPSSGILEVAGCTPLASR